MNMCIIILKINKTNNNKENSSFVTNSEKCYVAQLVWAIDMVSDEKRDGDEITDRQQN